jgi:replicative DNA helicase
VIETSSVQLVDLRAEAAVLGGLLRSEGHELDCRDEVVDCLAEAGPDAFSDHKNRKVYGALLTCMMESRPTDPVSVVGELRTGGDLTDDLAEYVYSLPRQAGVLTGVIYDARSVLDLYRKRELKRILNDGDKLVSSGEGTYEEVAGGVSAAVSDIVDKAIRSDSTFEAVQVAESALGHLFGAKPKEPGLPTGFPDLDELTGGMRPGQVIVIAGRPGMGKTTLGAQIARFVAKRVGKGVVFFSLEMSKDELGQRNASAETSIPFQKIREGEVDQRGLDLLTEYISGEEDVNYIVDDDPDQTVGEIALKTRKLVKDRNVGLAVIDYLQLVKPNKPTGNRVTDVAQVSEGIRKMSRTLGIPVIALAQLNRESAGRDGGKPKVTDLRESGQIEQDAHQVILVHLEYKVNPETERGKMADFILAKNRGGITAEREAEFDGARCRFIPPHEMIGTGL